MAAIPETTPLKCFNMSPEAGIFAVGYTTGRTTIMKHAPEAYERNSVEIIGDFMPRHMRSCNVVAFCPTAPRLLLSGLDKVRYFQLLPLFAMI